MVEFNLEAFFIGFVYYMNMLLQHLGVAISDLLDMWEVCPAVSFTGTSWLVWVRHFVGIL
jgi:hypothetical protein